LVQSEAERLDSGVETLLVGSGNVGDVAAPQHLPVVVVGDVIERVVGVDAASGVGGVK
jgi:hypothetical protein